jgi:hypothetical protein
VPFADQAATPSQEWRKTFPRQQSQLPLGIFRQHRSIA